MTAEAFTGSVCVGGIDLHYEIGMSFGGNTLLHVATLAPERVSAMALVSATLYFPEHLLRPFWERDPPQAP